MPVQPALEQTHLHQIEGRDGSWVCIDLIWVGNRVMSVQWYSNRDVSGGRKDFL